MFGKTCFFDANVQNIKNRIDKWDLLWYNIDRIIIGLGKSRWADNIMIERWFRSLKTELIYINDYASPKELRGAIRDYIEEYNSIRPHQSLDYLTPDQVYGSSFGASA